MDANLQRVYEQVMQAEHPEDLFGAHDIALPPDALLEHLAKAHEPMQTATNPAMYQDPEDSEAAKDAQRKLQRLYAGAQERIKQMLYGMPGRGKPRPGSAAKHFEISGKAYYVGRELMKNPRSASFEGFLEIGRDPVGEVLISVANSPESNHFLQTAARAHDVLHESPVPQWKHLPYLLDRFSTANRMGLIYRSISGSSLAQVRNHRAHRRGVDQRHMAWILDRILSCLGYVHRCGLVHGNLNPESLLVQPASHNVVITGWEHSVHRPAVTGEKVALHSQEFSAPEVLSSGRLGPWSDLYSVGKLMIWLLGGNPAEDSIPDGVETTVSTFLRRMTQEDLYKRPSDAWELHAEHNRIRDALWPRQFLHLDLS